MSDVLSELSSALTARAAAARDLVAAILTPKGGHLTATVWAPGVLVASAQSLPDREELDILLPGGTSVKATVAGRDPGTNVAVLRCEAVSAAAPAQGEATAGMLALAFGADGGGGATARLGVVNIAGPEWLSSAGGRIDRRIVLDMRLAGSEEGGPALDGEGRCLGITTFGPRRQALVIPWATVDRVVPGLLENGRVARGWLGVALRPVALPEPLQRDAGQTTGLMVMSLAEQGPAAKAGVIAGDILVGVDGAPAQRFRRIARQLGSESVGRTVDLRLVRAGAVLSVKTTVEARPAE